MAKTWTLYSNIGDYYGIKKGIIKYKAFIPAKSQIKPGNKILIQPVLPIGAYPGYGLKVGADVLEPVIKTVSKVRYYKSDHEAFKDEIFSKIKPECKNHFSSLAFDEEMKRMLLEDK